MEPAALPAEMQENQDAEKGTFRKYASHAQNRMIIITESNQKNVAKTKSNPAT